MLGDYTSDWMEHIPLGFRFCPTDYEALTYLFHKFFSQHKQNIRLEVVQELDVYEYQPFHLPRNGEEEFCYYFTHRSVLSKTKINRNTRDGKGYWRITSTNTKFMMRKKNTLVYYLKSKDERGKGTKTNWIMHEYVLHNGSPTTALCRIYERKESEEKETQMKIRESDIYNWTKDVGVLQSNLDFSLKYKLESAPPRLRNLRKCEYYADIHNNLSTPADDDDVDDEGDIDDKSEDENVNSMDLSRNHCYGSNRKFVEKVNDNLVEENFGRYDKQINENVVEGYNVLDSSLGGYDQQINDNVVKSRKCLNGSLIRCQQNNDICLDLSLGIYDQRIKENVVEENNNINLGFKRYDRINGTGHPLVYQYMKKLELAIQILETTKSISLVDEILEEIKSLSLMNQLSEIRNNRKDTGPNLSLALGNFMIER